MTAVRPAWRGRGIATAIKRATIAWAIDNGLAALETGNDEHNAPMRAVNARLGYRPIPDSVGLQGPLAPAGCHRADALTRRGILAPWRRSTSTGSGCATGC